MSDLYLSYAAFAYYTKENGYELTKHRGIREEIHLWFVGGNMFPFPLYEDRTSHICGCIYTNDEDIKEIFAEDTKTKNILLAKCKLPYYNISKVINPHCTIEPSLRGKETVIDSGETISCKRKAVVSSES